MIGVFDSGEGGENALAAIRRLCPSADATFFADRKNAPYGRKSPDELVRLLERGITRLLDAGCERVLIACCTASTVHGRLRGALAERSLPIVHPTAEAALRAADGGSIAVIATDATVRSHAFRDALGESCALEVAASPLVSAIERGAKDGAVSDALGAYLDRLLRPVSDTGADVLLLGCTHFVRLEGEISRRLYAASGKKIITVDSAEVGAREILRFGCSGGSGRTVRI